MLAPDDLSDFSRAAPVGTPVGRFEREAQVHHRAIEENANLAINLRDSPVNVRTMELSSRVRRASSISSPRKESIEILDGGADQRAAIQNRFLVGGNGDPAIDFRQQGRCPERPILTSGQRVRIEKVNALRKELRKTESGDDLTGRQRVTNALHDQDFGAGSHPTNAFDHAREHGNRNGNGRRKGISEVRLEQDAPSLVRSPGRLIAKVFETAVLKHPSVKMTAVRVQVLFFGLLRDITGKSEEEIELPVGSRLGDVFAHYAAQFPRLGEIQKSIVLARNQDFSSAEEAIADGDEIALLPPVSGGAPPTGSFIHQIEDPEGHFFALTRERIDTEDLKRALLQDRDGAMVDFEGVVRNQSQGRATRFLDYECYEKMAIQMMARIGREIAAKHEISRIAMVHRLGRLEIGEASVVVVACSPHRRAAFEAALEGINRLKSTVPIWKKEYFADGEVWVEGDWDAGVVSIAGA